jgi:hypothetical protein
MSAVVLLHQCSINCKKSVVLKIKLLPLHKFIFMCRMAGSGDLRQVTPPSRPTRHFNFKSFQSGGEAVNSMEEKQYLSPAVQVLELYSEGVLCASSGTETLEENEGIW